MLLSSTKPKGIVIKRGNITYNCIHESDCWRIYPTAETPWESNSKEYWGSIICIDADTPEHMIEKCLDAHLKVLDEIDRENETE